MARTRISLPDAPYQRAKQVAEQQGISLAELTRRGLEHMLRLYPPAEQPASEWCLPTPRRLGTFRAQVEDWRELASTRS